MPRFDNEGFNPNRRMRNDSRDRSVPEGENYYINGERSIDSYANYNDNVVDRQNSVDINEYINSFDPPRRSPRQMQNGFEPEVLRDYDRERREKNARNAQQRKPHGTSKPPKKKARLSIGKKIIISLVALLLAIVLIITGLFNGVMGRINYDERVAPTIQTEVESSAMVKNILLLGVDARSEDDDEKSRADSMMLISIDAKHKCIKMISFLRDTWVYIPAKDGEQRLNAACTYGGYNGVVEAIEYNFGVKIDGYVVADFEMFKVLVDGIGGVEVDVTKKEAKEVTSHKKRYGNVKLEAGKHTLTGEQALAYCRIRKIDTDFMRTKRQRTVMQSIIKGVKSANVFSLYKMARNAAPYIETNMSKGEIMLAGAMAITCMKGEMLEARVPFEHTWEYANKHGASVIAINTEKNKEMLIDYIYNQSPEDIKANEEG